MPKRNTAVKASVGGGYETLSKLPGKVYDNVLFKNEAGWDPAGYSVDAAPEVVKHYRDAELTHGRIAMAAIAGILAAEKWHPFFPTIGGTAHEQLAAINEMYPAFKWFAIAHIWINEALRLYKFDISTRGDRLLPGEEPGDYKYDPLKLYPKTEAAQNQMKTREVNNGRLA